jgi:hypothetical protein
MKKRGKALRAVGRVAKAGAKKTARAAWRGTKYVGGRLRAGIHRVTRPRRKNPAGWVVKARKGTGGTHVFLFDGAKLGNGPQAIYPTLNGAKAAANALFAKYPKLYGRDWKVWIDVYGSNARP